MRARRCRNLPSLGFTSMASRFEEAFVWRVEVSAGSGLMSEVEIQESTALNLA